MFLDAWLKLFLLGSAVLAGSALLGVGLLVLAAVAWPRNRAISLFILLAGGLAVGWAMHLWNSAGQRAERNLELHWGGGIESLKSAGFDCFDSAAPMCIDSLHVNRLQIELPSGGTVKAPARDLRATVEPGAGIVSIRFGLDTTILASEVPQKFVELQREFIGEGRLLPEQNQLEALLAWVKLQSELPPLKLGDGKPGPHVCFHDSDVELCLLTRLTSDGAHTIDYELHRPLRPKAISQKTTSGR